MYCVVQFEASEGGTISVIAKKWLTPMKTHILWPPNVKGSKSLDRVLKRSDVPDETWIPYGVQRFFYETNNLEKAKKKLVALETTSDIQTEEENDAVNKKRKRQRNKKFGSDSDSSDEDTGLSHPPPLKRIFLNVQDNDKENDVISYSDDADISIVEHTTPVKWPAATIGNAKKTKLPSPLKALSSSVQYKAPVCRETQKDSGQRPGGSGIGSSKALSIEPNLPESPKTKIVLSDKIISLLSEIKVQNQKIIDLLSNSAHTYYEPLHEDFKFPIQNEEEMIVTETLLVEDSKRKQLVSYLKSLGGREVKDKVTRLMKFTLADNLARLYNYYGKRSHKKPFSESRLRQCVIEAVKATTANVTDREIEDTIKTWLKHAPEREKKRLSRNASQEVQQD